MRSFRFAVVIKWTPFACLCLYSRDGVLYVLNNGPELYSADTQGSLSRVNGCDSDDSFYFLSRAQFFDLNAVGLLENRCCLVTDNSNLPCLLILANEGISPAGTALSACELNEFSTLATTP